MNHFAKRALALLTGWLVLLSGASALTVDSGLTQFMDENSDVHFALSAQLSTLSPYGEETVALLNTVLEHVSVTAEVTGGATELTLRVAGDPVASFTETAAEGGTQLTTPLLPNRTLVSTGSVMDALGLEQEEPTFDLFAALDEVENRYQQLTDAILPYAEQKKANYKISGVGTSTWSRIARLTPEQSAELSPLIAQVLGCGMDEAYREELRNMTYSKGFIVGLYQSAQDGDDLAVYIKGGVTFADGGYRTLSYQWAFATKENGERVDTYKFEMNRSKGAKDDREISATCKRRSATEGAALESECKELVRDPESGGSVTTTTSHDLTAAQSGNERLLEGSVTTAVRTSDGDDAVTMTTTITPRLALLSSEGSGVLSGSAAVERISGKTVDLSAVITFDEQPAERFAEAADSGMLFIVIEDEDQPKSSLMQNMDEPAEEADDYLVGKPPAGYESHSAPAQETVVDMDHLTEEETAALLDELAQNLAGKLIIAIAKLPAENSALLQDNLSESDFAALLALVEGL